MTKVRTRQTFILLILATLVAFLVIGCGGQTATWSMTEGIGHMVEPQVERHEHMVEQHAEEHGPMTGHHSESQNLTAESLTSATPDVTFTLRTQLTDHLSFVGVGGDIDGVANPTLRVQPGDVVQVTLVNGDGIEHDVAFANFNIHSSHVASKEDSTSIIFQTDEAGTFPYHCTIPGHRQAGMEGRLIVEEG